MQGPFLGAVQIVAGTWIFLTAGVLFPAYSGTLVSFFSFPFYAKAINTLDELHEEMLKRGDDAMSLGK